ncbi:MAG: 2'-deoxycytidine 5'-triphosphate deaminase [Parvibaculales bacterium]
MPADAPLSNLSFDKNGLGEAEKTSQSTSTATAASAEHAAGHVAGILPAHGIVNMVREKQILSNEPIVAEQIQPASLDLRLGRTAYRIRASFLPGAKATVQEKLKLLTYHEIDLREGAVLETGCVYLVPLLESLNLPERITAFANPKSSTGRIDVFTRVITDFGTAFDTVCGGYKGALYLEVTPRTFPILVRAGSRLSQIRFRRGPSTSCDDDIRQLQHTIGLVDGEADIDNGLALSINLQASKAGDSTHNKDIIGYRAKRHAGLIDVDAPDCLDVRQYWEPIYHRADQQIILDPDEFYILASREAVTIPPTHAAEMIPFNPLMGEFRVHYAGFFDPGFGAEGLGAQKAGDGRAHAVLEVRSREVPFIVEHGQIIGRLVYERLTETPEKLYGDGLKSHYQAQGLKLSKHFKQDF